MGYPLLVTAIDQRVVKWTMLPEANQEALQVLRYEETQEYKPHPGKDDNGGNRACTVLMYLNSVEEGGETIFPMVPVGTNQSMETGFSECAMQGLAYKPQKGDALAFWSIQPRGLVDPESMHGSCPVIKGEKWSATKW
eukprot:gene23224-30445_t